MHIGIDIRMIGRKRTGDETVFLNLTKHVAALDGGSESRNRYTLFLDRRTPEEIASIERLLALEGKKNFRIVSLPTNDKFVWNFRTLPNYLRQHPVDVYHTQYIVPFFIPRSTKVVTHIHDISFCVYPRYIAWKDRLFLSLLIPRSLRRADRIIAVSSFTKREIVAHYGVDERKIAVIQNALSGDIACYEPYSEERMRAVCEKYGVPPTYLLYVGTLQPRKNIPALIRAFALMRDKLPESKLVIVGNRRGHHADARIDEAVTETHTEASVIFPGFVDQEDLPVIFRMARVFVFPSLYEGFGLPPLEAMAQHVPAVVSDIPSLRETGGEAAVFVDTSDIATFAETLYTTSVASATRQTLVELGIRQVKRFSWDASARDLKALYESLVLETPE
jgi:glycosyltransferase involved in cell wall biosynthesis